MIVADTNLLVYRSIETPFAPLAKRWFEVDPLWMVPTIWRFEFTNAIVMHVRKGVITRAEGATAIDEAIKTYSSNEIVVDQTTAFNLAMQLRLSAYDANFILLAQALGTYCVTGDQQMLERAPRWARGLLDFK